MIVELILVFDTDDEEDGESVSLEAINRRAEELNLATASTMLGYQGWRVEVVEKEA